MTGGGSHSDFDNELTRVDGQLPPMEGRQWWLGPAIVLGLAMVGVVVVFVVAVW
ncbi:hypothetical protein [Salsipaludibacter albus]|uniref:hypothetical protein n=1 Tax=Salsipaludibacter albus TaxID=2849650 RepID=UPI001EE48CD2|nr:hypothetical protein [Salsipaludibacter albus]MBY5163366.1 hypothetical protein [Salsipaludibacter albus]